MRVLSLRNAEDWISEIERKMGVPVTLIGTGPDALDMIDRRAELLTSDQ